ncbi:MAG: hypothetical protein RLZZ470_802 [Pseudomonadota bacterium]|jgi:hypothetical protein
MMVFSMPCLNANPMLEARRQSRHGPWLAFIITCVLSCFMGLVQAQQNVQANDVHLERGEDGLYLSASLDFELPASLEDALTRGMPLNFLIQADVMRERWYWYDKRIQRAERHIRISYQPLSRRWRVHVSPQAIQATGLGVTMGSSYDNLKDALQAVQKINRWKVADWGVLKSDAKQRLDLNFMLDLSQLPQALQFGNLSSSDWVLELQRSMRIDESGP